MKAERTSTRPLQLKATGDLTINGKTKQVAFTVDVALQPDGSAAASGSLIIHMAEFGVEAPTAMLGLVRAYDGITVKFEIGTVALSTAHASVP